MITNLEVLQKDWKKYSIGSDLGIQVEDIRKILDRANIPRITITKSKIFPGKELVTLNNWAVFRGTPYQANVLVAFLRERVFAPPEADTSF